MTTMNTGATPFLAISQHHYDEPGSQVSLQMLNGRAHCSTNSGVTSSDENTFLPLDDWSLPKSIPKGTSVPLSVAVTTFDLGAELCKSFRRELPALLDIKTASDDDRRSSLNRVANEVCLRMNRLGVSTDGIRVSNVAVNPPGTKSTGRDFEKNVYVGLHIDDHDKLPLESRAGAIQLLALNCGATDRHFHFVDLPVGQLMALCDGATDLRGSRVARAATSPSERLKNRFFARYADRPVIRVTLPPGHAYVATPQNIIHDGAGGSTDAADVAFLLLGRFALINS